jgi:Fur family transcriptional regulator, peroxide stress response regulator
MVLNIRVSASTMTTVELFLKTLRQAGYRLTPQRRAICAYLATTDQHPTPYAVYAALAAQDPEISRATVYNTLNALHQLGAIVPINLGDDHTHYETNLAPHVNLICQQCHRVIDQPATALVSALQDIMAQTAGFAPTAIQIQVLGLCAYCQQKATSS